MSFGGLTVSENFRPTAPSNFARGSNSYSKETLLSEYLILLPRGLPIQKKSNIFS